MTPSHSHRLAAGLIGGFAMAAFVGLSETLAGLNIIFSKGYTYSSPGEVYFWLGHALLLFPGACLLGYALSPWLGPLLARSWRGIEQMDRRQRAAGLLLLTVATVLVARAGHALFLLDYPVTDDENAARFGGQVLAMGRLMVPAPQPFNAFPRLYLYLRDGMVTSFDWPGPQLAWAVAELSGLGPWVFALAAALPVPCLGYILARRLGRPWGALVCLVFLLSPMAFALSLTTHAHLLSRGLLALGLVLFVRADSGGSLTRWTLTGLALGAGFLCRPPEIACLSLPLLADRLVRAVRREPGAPRAVAGLLLGGAMPLLLFALHNWQVTGDPLLPPRMGPGAIVWFQKEAASLWSRFGANTSYNLFMLTIWFLGPLGVLLVSLGAMTDRFTRLLGLGVLTALGLGLFHDDHGLHIVGPIHYSECVVPLSILAVHGLANLVDRCRSLGLGLTQLASMVFAALVLGLGSFNALHTSALHRQALVQDALYGFAESSGIRHAVVLAPNFANTWKAIPPLREVGSCLLFWRYVRPDLSDDVMFLRDGPGMEERLRREFRDRAFFRLSVLGEPPYLHLEPLPDVEDEAGGSR